MSKNNQILLDAIIKQEMEDLEENIPLSDFFEFYSALQVLKENELSYDEINTGIAGKSHDGGADSLYLFVNGELVKEDDDLADKYKKNVDIEFVLIQSKYENKFSEDPLLKLSRLCRSLFDLDFNPEDYIGQYNEHVLSAFELFKKTYVGLITKKPRLKISVYYVSKGIDIHPNVYKQAASLENDIIDKLPASEAKVHFLGAEKLVKMTQERPNDVFRLKISETPLSTSGQVFIALTNLVDYYNFITDENGKLIRHIFESNVRDYQGKTNVNNEIQDTLENPGDEEFWWLNNGVTILASEVAAPGGKELVVHNPEIVNGLQTSSEIHRFYNNNKDKIEGENRDVLVRIIVAESEETRDRIIRATNSQTPIPKSSLRATDQVHRQIEDFLKPRGLYYDRRKNFYKNEGKKPKEIISVPFMSQCLISVLMQKPNFARARPSTLLEDDESYSKLFHKNNDLQTYYLVALLGRKIEEQLKKDKAYTTIEIADIKFYILYTVSCLMTNSLYPGSNQIAQLKQEDLTDDMFNYALATTYDLYREYGGTNKVAKGAKLIEELKDKIRADKKL
ncbi:AIPR family protein [uncultured Pseudoalteromonas sp.]|uniref:AIPR family protein n=1 Tax=unclassified Pseudoalteromonas TaxID=194690 RepID=UPI0030DD6640|tara:strand:+ start:512 stop:2206 length:1695 start_codon:yes stop_codon:yes gene_type:complete